MTKKHSPGIILTASLRCNNLSYYAGRLALATAMHDDIYTRDVIKDIKEELRSLQVNLDAYCASPNPNVDPE